MELRFKRTLGIRAKKTTIQVNMSIIIDQLLLRATTLTYRIVWNTALIVISHLKTLSRVIWDYKREQMMIFYFVLTVRPPWTVFSRIRSKTPKEYFNSSVSKHFEWAITRKAMRICSLHIYFCFKLCNYSLP